MFVEKPTSEKIAEYQENHHWCKPDQGWTKINIDASFLKDTEKSY